MRGEGLVVAAVVAGVVLAWESPAHACGPDFPVEWLVERSATALDMPERVFLYEVTRLVPAPARPYRVGTTDDAEAVARTRGGGEERALYERGARAFAAGDRAAARTAFETLLALPADQRYHRSTWAAYMLGRMVDGAGPCEEPCTAADYARVKRPGIDAYRRVRTLVAAGFADELGLAAASLGQEARMHLATGDVATAVRLYAEQAAHGHRDGPTSLLFVVRQVIADGSEVALATDPLGQHLLALYLDTRGDELAAPTRARVWRALLDAPELAAADQLASAAYRAGQWELAGQLAARAPTARLSRWVRGKLALRAGRRSEGQRLLEQVAAEVDADALRCGAAEEQFASARVHGELALLRLAEDDPVAAMQHAWRTREHYPDALFVAERILTLDELSDFVAALPATPTEALNGWPVVDAAELRGILARRLMRRERFTAAIDYFGPETRGFAVAYAAHVTRARTARDPIERAAHGFAASRLAREHGLDILGTSYGPDWGMYGANFALPRPSEHAASAAVTAFERERVAASAPAFDRRYHYRYIASALAETAADQLPHQSQAFAAALCYGARDVYNLDETRVQALWTHYVTRGARVDFAATFGQQCPTPAFAAARRYLPHPLPNRGPLVLGCGLIAIAACVGARSVARRRR